MTAKLKTFLKGKKAMLAALGAGLFVLPFAMPGTAKADDWSVRLNLGGPAYGYQPVAYRPVYYEPAPRVVYRDYEPRRVVYVSRPYYRERVIVRNDYRRWHDHDRGHHGGWDRDHRTAWR